MEDDYLVDCIQHEGNEKHLAGNSPQVSEHIRRLRRIACKSPKEDRPTFSGIRPSRSPECLSHDHAQVLHEHKTTVVVLVV
jgi:hypothetical protein